MIRPVFSYDFNVYGQDETELRLIAYPITLEAGEDGKIQPVQNYQNEQTLKLTFPKDLEAIEYLLDDLYINNYPLTDYDDWLDIKVIPDDCPEVIKEFLLELPTK
jgi:hypothetical protein